MGRYDWPQGVESIDDPTARERFNRRFLATADVRMPDGTLPPVAPRAARRAPRVAGAAATGGLHLWLPLGPSTVVGGQASDHPRVAGRVRDIAVEPTAGDRAYAASASGGVWFTGDRGVTWSPLHEFDVTANRDTLFPIGNILACGALHVLWGAAANGADDEVIVGTGEPGGSGGTPGGQMAGVGILRATGPATGGAWQPEAPALRGEAIWRIAEDPNNREMQFAATTDGLYGRPPGGAWTKVAALGLNPNVVAPWNKHVFDVLVTRLTGPDRVRIWIARWGDVQVAEVTNPPVPPAPIDLTTLVFTSVAPADVLSTTRLVLASARADEVWVLGRRQRVGAETIDPAHLWRINAGAAIGSLATTDITGVPPRLFFSAGDQSDYDMSVAVHPVSTNTLYLAGAATLIDNEWNAALYRVSVAGAVATPTLIGRGVHPDCHIVRAGPSPVGGSTRSIWVGCDGGVFKSDNDGDVNSFFARNTGLAVLQPGFVGCHPTNDGIVAAGMQDNGTCERVGDTVWREPFLGDGGGVVYDPSHPNRYLRQYTQATWRSSDRSGIPPVLRRRPSTPTGGTTSETAENDRALFYSGAAAIAHGGTTHLALGTDRVWYSADWGASWVTLPTATDPRRDNNVDLSQDVLQPGTANGQYTDTVPTFLCCTSDYHGTLFTNSGGVLTCKWSARSDDGGNHRVRLNVLWNGGMAIFDGTRPTSSTGAWAWARDRIEPVRGPATPAEQAAVDNGDTVAFLPGLGLVNDVAVHDPALGGHGSCYVATIGGPGSGAGHEIDTLWWYDGVDNWTPCGLRRDFSTGGNPRATWTGQRVVSPALSVVVDPDDRSIVYVGTSVAVVQGTLTFDGGNQPHWAWTAYDNGLPEAAVHDLAIFNHDGVKLLRAALQARGVWESDLVVSTLTERTYLRLYPTDMRRRRPSPLTGPPVNGEPGPRWDASPDIVFDTTSLIWPTPGPGEPDLFALPFAGEVAESAAQSFSTRQFRVHVLVHHRWHAPAAPAGVKVALVRHDGPDSGDVTLGGIWATLVSVAGGGAAPGTLPGGWIRVDPQLTRAVAAPVDARTPRSVTFDVDLTGVPDGTRVTFLAVVMSNDDQLTAAEAVKLDSQPATTVAELVVHSRHAAARTLLVR